MQRPPNRLLFTILARIPVRCGSLDAQQFQERYVNKFKKVGSFVQSRHEVLCMQAIAN